MTTAHKITVGLAVMLGLFMLIFAWGWIKEHEAAMIVQTQVKSDNEAAAQIAAAEERNKEELSEQLGLLVAQRAAVQTPQQVVRALPTVINLPAPVTQVTAAQAQAYKAAVPLDTAAPQAGDLVIPQADAKSFYDTQLDCKVNAAKLSSCDAQFQNEQDMVALKDTEIKQLQVAVNGGTKWQRFKSASKWLALGVGVGAVGAIAAHH